MSQLEKLTEDWKETKKIVIYGFGKIAQGNIDIFIDWFDVQYIIDNNIKYEGQLYRGIEILSLESYLKLNTGRKMVVLTGKKAYRLICKELESGGLEEFKDFCDMNCFYEDWFWNYKKTSCLGRIIVTLTTRCTLNCAKCNMLTPYNVNKRDFLLDDLKEDLDFLFKSVDYISNLVLVGGEVFLYKDLLSYIDYVGKKYGKYIGNLQIITNGMIIPSTELMKCMKKNNVEVRISDYSNSINYKDKLNKFYKTLEDNDIHYIVFDQSEWLDFGFPEEDLNMGDTKEKLRRHMQECQPMCPIVNDKKLFFCTSSWAAHECKLFELQEGDYLDLEKIAKDDNRRNRLIRFYFGDLENDYMSFCRKCRGFANNNHVIQAAIQYKQ